LAAQFDQAFPQFHGPEFGTASQPSQHRVAGCGHPTRAVVGDLAAFEVLDQLGGLLLGDTGRRATHCGRQQVSREHEQGSPHRELFDQRLRLEQHVVHISARKRVDAGEER